MSEADNLDNYRIHRVDSQNLSIQKWKVSKKTPPGGWHTISYHGNSSKSLVSGLLEVVTSIYTPDAAKLSEQLKTMELQRISMQVILEKMIERTILRKDKDTPVQMSYNKGDSIIVVAGPSAGLVGYVRESEDKDGYVAVTLFDPGTNEPFDISVARENLIKG